MKILIKDILAVIAGADGTPEASVTNVCVTEGLISAIGTVPPDFAPDETIDGRGKLLTPGLVNAHTHAYMSGFRNWADDCDFDTWLFRRIMPAEDSLTPEDAYWYAALSCVEMLRGGVTAFLDMHMFPEMSVRAAVDSGMRAVISRGLSGGDDDNEGGARRLREAVAEYEKYAGKYDNLSFMLGPHAITTCDEGYFREIAAVSRELGLGIHTHMSEGRVEGELCASKYGCTPAELYDRCGLLTASTVAAHCIHLSDGDIELLHERGVSVALNPASNLKLANGIAPVPKLLAAKVSCCLGTDSSASNNSLSILREMGLTALLHKGVTGDPCVVSAAEVFLMATRNGASALGLDGTGEISVGKKADLAIFDIDQPELLPLGNPLSALCYTNGALKADTVFVGGRKVVEGGRTTLIDTERVMREVKERYGKSEIFRSSE